MYNSGNAARIGPEYFSTDSSSFYIDVQGNRLSFSYLGYSAFNQNLGIATSGTPTARLQVKGSGTTSATTSLLVQNSSALDILRLQDDGKLYLGNATNPATNFNIISYSGATPPRIRLRNSGLSDTGGPDGTEIMSVSGSFNADSDSYGGIKLLTQTNFTTSQLAFYTGSQSGSGTKQMTLRNDGSLVVSTSAHLPTAKLQVDSTTQGALLPRMTTTQRNAIVTPATGLIVYDTTLLSFYQYNGTAWLVVGENGTQSFVVACSDETTAITTGTSKVTFRIPYAFTLTSVRASLTIAQTSGTIFTVDINENGTSILSTKLTIDNTEKTSTTAAILPVISDSSLADDSEITIDVDQIGDGTAKGLKVVLIGYKS
jgi:hypothetical protein